MQLHHPPHIFLGHPVIYLWYVHRNKFSQDILFERVFMRVSGSYTLHPFRLVICATSMALSLMSIEIFGQLIPQHHFYHSLPLTIHNSEPYNLDGIKIPDPLLILHQNNRPPIFLISLTTTVFCIYF